MDLDQLIQQAYRLGSIDRLADRPARDMADDGSAWLMAELGQDSPTTAANHADRVAMCDAYLDGWHDSDSALRD